MLFRPVYLKGQKMQEAPIPMVAKQPPKPPEEPPPPIPPPQPEPSRREVTPEDEHLPMLISNYGFTTVIPKEATRDVLTGKVAYLLVDEKGITKFTPRHNILALELHGDRLEKYEDYPCIGGHERVLEKTGKPAKYKRRYIDIALIKRGLYRDGVYVSCFLFYIILFIILAFIERRLYIGGNVTHTFAFILRSSTGLMF